MPSAFDGYRPRERVKVKVQCSRCGGTGDEGPARTPEGDWLDQPCRKCLGAGKVEIEQ
jgi:DnaJ-class molecular chaperone